jgi:hypothetical protein
MTAFVLQRYSYREIAAQMAEGDALAFLPYVIVAPILYMAAAGFADALVLRSVAPLDYFTVFRGKCATASLAALSYSAGAGAYGVWIAKRSGQGAKAASGALLYLMWSDLTGVCLLGAGAMYFAGTDLPKSLSITAGAIALFQPLVTALGIPQKFPFFPKVPLPIVLAQLGVRVGAVSISGLATWAGANAFGLAIPFADAAVHLPIILSVQSLPVNVGGFGAVQGVWLLSFAKHGSGEKILAFQILWQAALGVAMVLRGLPFLQSVSRELAQERLNTKG